MGTALAITDNMETEGYEILEHYIPKLGANNSRSAYIKYQNNSGIYETTSGQTNELESFIKPEGFGSSFPNIRPPKFLIYNETDAPLISWWKFDEGSGSDIEDSSGNGHHGTSYNSPAYVSSANTALNWSLDFEEASNEYILYGDNDDFSFTAGGGNDLPFSVDAWVQLESYDLDTEILSKYQNSNGLREYEWIIEDGEIYFTMWDQNNYGNRLYVLSSTTFGEPSSWAHLTFTYDGSNDVDGMTVYYNGVNDTGTRTEYGTYPGMTNTAQGLSTSADGKLDNIRIWNGELTASEVSYLYNNAPTGAGPNIELDVQVRRITSLPNPATNIALNPSFEDGSSAYADYWSGTGGRTTPAHWGDASMSIGFDEAYWIEQDITNTSVSDFYSFTYWRYKISSSTNITVQFIYTDATHENVTEQLVGVSSGWNYTEILASFLNQSKTIDIIRFVGLSPSTDIIDDVEFNKYSSVSSVDSNYIYAEDNSTLGYGNNMPTSNINNSLISNGGAESGFDYWNYGSSAMRSSAYPRTGSYHWSTLYEGSSRWFEPDIANYQYVNLTFWGVRIGSIGTSNIWLTYYFTDGTTYDYMWSGTLYGTTGPLTGYTTQTSINYTVLPTLFQNKFVDTIRFHRYGSEVPSASAVYIDDVAATGENSQDLLVTFNLDMTYNGSSSISHINTTTSWFGQSHNATSFPYNFTFNITSSDTQNGTMYIAVWLEDGTTTNVSVTINRWITIPSINITAESESSDYLWSAYGNATQGFYGNAMPSTQAYTISGMASGSNASLLSITQNATTFGNNPFNSGTTASWSFIYQIDSADSDNQTIVFTATDVVGNTNTTTYLFYEDATDPVVTITSLSETSSYLYNYSYLIAYYSDEMGGSLEELNVSGTATDGGVGLFSITDNTAFGDNPSNTGSNASWLFRYQIDSLDTGDYIIAFIATDLVGNTVNTTLLIYEDLSVDMVVFPTYINEDDDTLYHDGVNTYGYYSDNMGASLTDFQIVGNTSAVNLIYDGNWEIGVGHGVWNIQKWGGASWSNWTDWTRDGDAHNGDYGIRLEWDNMGVWWGARYTYTLSEPQASENLFFSFWYKSGFSSRDPKITVYYNDSTSEEYQWGTSAAWTYGTFTGFDSGKFVEMIRMQKRQSGATGGAVGAVDEVTLLVLDDVPIQNVVDDTDFGDNPTEYFDSSVWSATYEIDENDDSYGTFTITYTVIDFVNNSNTATFQFRLDNTDPTITFRPDLTNESSSYLYSDQAIIYDVVDGSFESVSGPDSAAGRQNNNWFDYWDKTSYVYPYYLSFADRIHSGDYSVELFVDNYIEQYGYYFSNVSSVTVWVRTHDSDYIRITAFYLDGTNDSTDVRSASSYAYIQRSLTTDPNKIIDKIRFTNIGGGLDQNSFIDDVAFTGTSIVGYDTTQSGYYSDNMGASPDDFYIGGTATDGDVGLLSILDNTTFGGDPTNGGSMAIWSFMYSIDQDNDTYGSFNVTYTVLDLCNNSFTTWFYFYLDDTTPTIQIDTGEIVENSPYLYYSGSGTDGYYSDNMVASLESFQIHGSCTDPNVASGLYTLVDNTTFGDDPTYSSSLADWYFNYQIDQDDNGNWYILYTVTDNVGHINTTNSFYFYEDTTPPSGSFDLTQDPDALVSNWDNDTTADTVFSSLSDGASPPASGYNSSYPVRYKLDSGSWGVWNNTLSKAWITTEGTRVLWISFHDYVNNTVEYSITIYVDLTYPVLGILTWINPHYSDNWYTSDDNTAQFNVTWTETNPYLLNATQVTISYEELESSPAAGVTGFSITITASPEGWHDITVEIWDYAGSYATNTYTDDADKLKLDNSLPTASFALDQHVDALEPNYYKTITAYTTLSGSTDNGPSGGAGLQTDYIRYRLNGGTWGSWNAITAQSWSGVDQNNNTLEVKIRDNVDLESIIYVDWVITDVVLPVLGWLTLNESWAPNWYDQAVSTTAQASINYVEKYPYDVDATCTLAHTDDNSPSGGNSLINFTITGEADGSYSISIRIRDRAGNEDTTLVGSSAPVQLNSGMAGIQIENWFYFYFFRNDGLGLDWRDFNTTYVLDEDYRNYTETRIRGALFAQKYLNLTSTIRFTVRNYFGDVVHNISYSLPSSFDLYITLDVYTLKVSNIADEVMNMTIERTGSATHYTEQLMPYEIFSWNMYAAVYNVTIYVDQTSNFGYDPNGIAFNDIQLNLTISDVARFVDASLRFTQNNMIISEIWQINIITNKDHKSVLPEVSIYMNDTLQGGSTYAPGVIVFSRPTYGVYNYTVYATWQSFSFTYQQWITVESNAIITNFVVAGLEDTNNYLEISWNTNKGTGSLTFRDNTSVVAIYGTEGVSHYRKSTTVGLHMMNFSIAVESRTYLFYANFTIPEWTAIISMTLSGESDLRVPLYEDQTIVLTVTRSDSGIFNGVVEVNGTSVVVTSGAGSVTISAPLTVSDGWAEVNYNITGCLDSIGGSRDFISNDLDVIWDSVLVMLSMSQANAYLGEKTTFSVNATYRYDGTKPSLISFNVYLDDAIVAIVSDSTFDVVFEALGQHKVKIDEVTDEIYLIDYSSGFKALTVTVIPPTGDAAPSSDEELGALAGQWSFILIIAAAFIAAYYRVIKPSWDEYRNPNPAKAAMADNIRITTGKNQIRMDINGARRKPSGKKVRRTAKGRFS